MGRESLAHLLTSATKSEYYHGLNYWSHLNSQIDYAARQIKIPISKAAGLFAVLSPNNAELNNWVDMLRVDWWLRSGCPGDRPTIHTFKHRWEAVTKVWESDNPGEVIGGRKVLAFYHNILFPFNPDWVTIDGHIINAWIGERVPLNQVTAGKVGSILDQIHNDLVKVAESHNLLPNQAQAIIWVVWRRMHKLESGSGHPILPGLYYADIIKWREGR